MAKRTKTILISTVVLVILILIILPKINFSDDNSPQGGPQMARGGALPVKAHIVKPEVLGNNVQTSGTILANEEVELKSEVPGKIVRIAFREGSNVSAGQLLVKINDAELQAQLARTKHRLQLIEDREFRQKSLLEKEAISQEDYDVSLNELNIAKSEIQLIEAQIDQTEIKAPFNGVIGLKSVSEGSYVTSSTIIATLQNINPIKIDFSIPEKYAGYVKSGDKVQFRIVGDDDVYTGTVYAAEPKIDPVTRTLRLRATYPNRERKIIPGSFADITLILQQIENAYMVPTQSIVPELKGQKVYLVKGGKVSSQQVEIGVRTDERVQIISGVNERDTIITSGILQIKPGMSVTVSEFN